MKGPTSNPVSLVHVSGPSFFMKIIEMFQPGLKNFSFELISIITTDESIHHMD